MTTKHTTPKANRAQINALLDSKPVIHIPIPMWEWINRQTITPTAKQVFVYHYWSAMCGGGETLRSTLPPSYLARVLGLNERTIDSAHSQLKQSSMIERQDVHGPDGSTLAAETYLTIPVSVIHQFAATPDRKKKQAPEPSIALGDAAASTSPSGDPPKTISRGDQEEQRASQLRAAQAKIDKWQTRLTDLQKRYGTLLGDPTQRDAAEAIGAQVTASTLQVEHLIQNRKKIEASPLTHNRPTKLSTGLADESPSRRLDLSHAEKVTKAIGKLPRVSAPSEVLDQVMYQLSHGYMRVWPITKALHVSLHLIRQNRWRRPAGYAAFLKKNPGSFHAWAL